MTIYESLMSKAAAWRTIGAQAGGEPDYSTELEALAEQVCMDMRLRLRSTETCVIPIERWSAIQADWFEESIIGGPKPMIGLPR